jgi:hypothetical protein
MRRKRNKNCWSAKELALLREPLSNYEVATMTGRTQAAVCGMRRVEQERGVSGIHRPERRATWSMEHLQLLKDNDKSLAELAKIVGRNEGAVRTMRDKVLAGSKTVV